MGVAQMKMPGGAGGETGNGGRIHDPVLQPPPQAVPKKRSLRLLFRRHPRLMSDGQAGLGAVFALFLLSNPCSLWPNTKNKALGG
jgi:hypothetical protein